MYVVQTGGGERPNDSLMELLFLINAFRLASADSITVITPFFPYRRVAESQRQNVICITGDNLSRVYYQR